MERIILNVTFKTECQIQLEERKLLKRKIIEVACTIRRLKYEWIGLEANQIRRDGVKWQ